MKVLISPVNAQEAVVACECGLDIIDIKNKNKGLLGMRFPWSIQDIISHIPDIDIAFGTTLGHLPYDPGIAASSAFDAVSAGAKYIVAGLYGPKNVTEGIHVMRAVVRTCKDYEPETTVLAAGYADYQRFNGLSPEALIEVAVQSESDMVVLDTFFKDGKNLFDILNDQQLEKIVCAAHQNGLTVALAGRVKTEHLEPFSSLCMTTIDITTITNLDEEYWPISEINKEHHDLCLA